MASTLVQFRTEDSEKIMATQILAKLGLTLPAYLRMCVARLNQEKGVPFSMKLDENPPSPGIEAMQKASRTAEENGISEMSLMEINAEIAATRRGE